MSAAEEASPAGPPVDQVGPWRLEQSDVDERVRWVPIGTRSSGVLGRVDPAGLVGPAGAGWSLDWWVGADDRWYLPARETAVRQGIVDNSPVVETRQRVPGGDITHRVFAAQGSATLGGREAIVVEITNDTPVPVALSLAIRPYAVEGPDGLDRLERIDGRTVSIDGDWTLVTDREARLAAIGHDGADPVGLVTRGEAGEAWTVVEADAGDASVALVFPLPHTATMRMALVSGAAPPDAVAAIEGLPPSDAVASGWARQSDHGMRAVLPDPAMAAAFESARQRLLLGAPDLVDASSRTEQALVADSLSQLGHHEELRPVIGALLDEQGLTGSIDDALGSEAADGAALVVFGSWWRHDPQPDLLDELVGPLAKAAHRIERRRRIRKHRKKPRKVGLFRDGPQPIEVGGPTMAYLDAWWSAAGLLAIAPVLAAGGQHDASIDAERSGQAVLTDVDRSLDSVTAGLDEDAIPAGPDRALDEGMVALLVALGPLAVCDPEVPRVARTLRLVRDDLAHEDGWVRAGVASDGASPWLTACLALHEISVGDERGLDRLDWLVRVAGPSLSWPRVVDEQGRGDHVRGDDPAAAALFVAAVRSILVTERRRHDAGRAVGLDILPVMPKRWFGSGIEAHDMPTTLGRFGFAVRWHGERPALLWELDPSPGVDDVVISASGLVPGWETTSHVGETLLPLPQGAETVLAPAAPAVEGTSMSVDDDVSFS